MVEIREYHNALEKLSSVVFSIESKARAHDTLYQHEMASHLYELAQKIEEAASTVQKFMNQEQVSHLKSQQIGQSMVLSTLVHLADRGKENQASE
jgi:hypothetical protein